MTPTEIDELELKHFSPETDPKINWETVSPAAIKLLDNARTLAGTPFQITSNYRTPDHSVAVGGICNDAHTENPCTAFDIAYSTHQQRAAILIACIKAGFERWGWNDKNNHVHVDCSPHLPSPACWIE